MPILNREQFLSKRPLRTETVDVPELGEGAQVIVSEMTARARDAYERSLVDLRGKTPRPMLENVRAKLVARCVVDESGAPLFTEADVEAVGDTSAAAMDRLYAAAQRLNGMTKADEEELVKNSDGPSDA
jgi:hypothetical protein